MAPCSFCASRHNNEMSRLGHTVQNKPDLREPDRFPGGECAKRSQSRGVRLGPEGETRETNPISPGDPGSGAQNVQNEPNLRAERLTASLQTQGRSCETNPICPPLPGGTRRRGRRAIMQNKPNSSRSRPGDGGYRAKQSQFREVRLGPEGETCETNSISRRGWAARPEGRGAWGFCKTNPIPALMPIRRSAFPGAGGGEIDRVQGRLYNSLVCQATRWDG